MIENIVHVAPYTRRDYRDAPVSIALEHDVTGGQ